MLDPMPDAQNQFHIYECSNIACHFRYPLHQLAHEAAGATMACPQCKESAHQVITFGPTDAVSSALPIATLDPKNTRRVEVLLDNVRSIFNVGSIFRTADGANIQHLHLCGITPTPEHRKLAKTALGAEKSIPWTYHKNGLDAVKTLKADGRKIWGLEETARSKSLYTRPPLDDDPAATLVVILGNEISGVDPQILQQCDNVYHLPMAGAKRSLNIAVAFGIAIYHLQFGTNH